MLKKLRVQFLCNRCDEFIDQFLFNYQPLDNCTARAWAQIAETLGTQPIQLTRWLSPSLPDYPE